LSDVGHEAVTLLANACSDSNPVTRATEFDGPDDSRMSDAG
jgi:hypothetical protein